MIDQIDRRLTEWVAKTLGTPLTVSLTFPPSEHTDRGVSLFLLELADALPLRSNKRSPLQVMLRYLVTTWAAQPEDAHRLLGDLLFAALSDPEFDVEVGSVTPALWSALGVRPQPAFILRVLVRLERPEPEVHYVRKPLVVRPILTRALQGVVFSPEEVPLVGAMVQLPTCGLVTHTDSHGRFLFPSVPSELPIRELVVRAKGREVTVQVDATALDQGPLVIHFNGFDV